MPGKRFNGSEFLVALLLHVMAVEAKNPLFALFFVVFVNETRHFSYTVC